MFQNNIQRYALLLDSSSCFIYSFCKFEIHIAFCRNNLRPLFEIVKDCHARNFNLMLNRKNKDVCSQNKPAKLFNDVHLNMLQFLSITLTPRRENSIVPKIL